ncbi:MAG: hypothetical protein JXN61_17635 [Sedimentisphaerales bacterium]|nr:hypothetical protein [Sedimentisphaerales bacterium]
MEGSNEVEKDYPKYVCHAEKADKGRVYINKGKSFEGVREEVWEFHIGGYQVYEKWLKDRRGRELSYDDVRHYQRPCYGVAVFVWYSFGWIVNTPHHRGGG